MQENNKKYALITGGSQGIGRAIAYQLAQRKIPLLIVALDQPILQETAEKIRKDYQVDVQTFGIDLCLEDGPEQVYQWCQDNGYAVNILVNNAGFGRSGLMRAFQLSEYYTMLSLNNRATVGLTYLFLPELEKHDQSYILIMSSMEASLPLPYKAVYAGTKNFLYGYALALREEVAANNINVTVVCPGPTVTNESSAIRIQANKGSKLVVKMPDDVAKTAVDGLFRNKGTVIPGFIQSTFFKLGKHLPTTWKMKILEKVARKFRDNPG